MLECDPGAIAHSLEADLDLGERLGRFAGDEIGEHEASTRFPLEHLAEREAIARRGIVHFEQPTTDVRLEADAHGAVREPPAVRTPLVPDVDLVGENL